MLHGSGAPETVRSDPDLLETRSASFVSTSQGGVDSAMAAPSSTGGGHFHPSDTAI